MPRLRNNSKRSMLCLTTVVLLGWVATSDQDDAVVSFGYTDPFTPPPGTLLSTSIGAGLYLPLRISSGGRRPYFDAVVPCQGICWTLINRGNTVPIPRRLHLLIVVLIVVIVLPVVIMPTESAVAPVSCRPFPRAMLWPVMPSTMRKTLVWTLKRRSAD